MAHYEYKAVPAPIRGTKAKGTKTSADRFALTITNTLNEQSSDGWEYLRTETLPYQERSGLTKKTTNFQHLLIFRRRSGPPKVEVMPEQSSIVVNEVDCNISKIAHSKNLDG